jgi:hypothetical protein
MFPIEVALDCEAVVVGAPAPMRVTLRITLPEERTPAAIAEWEEYRLVDVDAAFPWQRVTDGFGTVQAELSSFVRDLQHLLATGEGSAVLEDEDGDSYLKLGIEDWADRSFRISARFYHMLTAMEPDPDEAEFFDRVWMISTGYQGVRIRGPQLASAVRELTAKLAAS